MQTFLTIVSCTIVIIIGILSGILLHSAWDYIDERSEYFRKSREESIKEIEKFNKELEKYKKKEL